MSEKIKRISLAQKLIHLNIMKISYINNLKKITRDEIFDYLIKGKVPTIKAEVSEINTVI